MRVAAYYRVSTRAQGEDDRLGLPVQVAGVEAYCAREGHEIVATYTDVGFSGSTIDRPQLAALLASRDPKNSHENGCVLFEAVIVHKWDRLARDTMLDGYLRYQLSQRGCAVVSASETNGVDPISTMTQQILAVVAQYERTLITQRLQAGRRLKKARGGYAGGKPALGLRLSEGVLVPCEAEIEALRTVQDLHGAGKSVRAITRALNDSTLRTRGGKPWASSTVHAMLGRRP